MKFLIIFGIFAVLHQTASETNEPTVTQTSSLSTVLGSKQYFVGILGKVNWYRANQICAARGMSLVSIESEVEAKSLRDYLYTNDILTAQFWTSANDLALRNEHTWASNGNKLGYTRWATAEPANDINKRCVLISTTFKWAKASCSNANYFICSRPIVPDCGIYGTCLYTFTPNF